MLIPPQQPSTRLGHSQLCVLQTRPACQPVGADPQHAQDGADEPTSVHTAVTTLHPADSADPVASASPTSSSPHRSGNGNGLHSAAPAAASQPEPLAASTSQPGSPGTRPPATPSPLQPQASGGPSTSGSLAPHDDAAAAAGPRGAAGTSEDHASSSEPPPPPATRRQRASKLAQRVGSGLALGLTGGTVILSGQYGFLALILFVVFHATQEYYGLLTSKGLSEGRPPPSRLVSVLTTVLCLSIALMSFNRAKSGTILAVSAFCLMVLEVVAAKRPRFSKLASSVFGLFYCGWLPSFWIKLRNFPLAAPDSSISALCASVGVGWTVGLLATFATVACIIAADTGAYFVGKNFGRTKLTDISPKKTVEGAVGGLLSSVAVALAMWRVCCWPPTWYSAVGLGVVTFFSGLFGDLIESIMKRDAGVKDSGDLIPGHGGLLDRFDSYMFSGAVTYFYVFFCLPWLGVAPAIVLV